MKTISAKALDKKFDNGEDISEYVDWSKAAKLGEGIKRVNVDFPMWVINCLDREARRIGVARQAIIKTWIADRASETKVHI